MITQRQQVTIYVDVTYEYTPAVAAPVNEPLEPGSPSEVALHTVEFVQHDCEDILYDLDQETLLLIKDEAERYALSQGWQ